MAQAEAGERGEETSRTRSEAATIQVQVLFCYVRTLAQEKPVGLSPEKLFFQLIYPLHVFGLSRPVSGSVFRRLGV